MHAQYECRGKRFKVKHGVWAQPHAADMLSKGTCMRSETRAAIHEPLATLFQGLLSAPSQVLLQDVLLARVNDNQRWPLVDPCSGRHVNITGGLCLATF